MQPFSADHYVVSELTDAGIDDLLRTLTRQPSRVRPPLGAVPNLPPLPSTLPPSTFALATEPTMPSPHWSVLPEPLAVTWRATLLDDRWGAQRAAMLELHIVPDGGDPLPSVRLRRFATTLASSGRSHGLFADTEGVTPRSDQTAVAVTTDGLAGSGVAVLRSGQCSAWLPLPRAKIGYVLDADDVAGRVTELLSLLAGLDIPHLPYVVPTIGIEPTTLVWEGSISDMNRTSVQMSPHQRDQIRLPADERLRWDDVVEHPDMVAQELTIRLLQLFRTRAS